MPKYSLFLPAPNIIRFGSFGFYQFIAPNVLPYALLLLALGVLHVWWMCHVRYHIHTWCIISTPPPLSILGYGRNPACQERTNGTVVPRKTNVHDEVATSTNTKPHHEQQAASAQARETEPSSLSSRWETMDGGSLRRRFWSVDCCYRCNLSHM